MRIGIDSRLPYYQMGGISQYVVQLVAALATIDADDEVLVFHSWKDTAVAGPEAYGNFHRARLYTPCHHRWERWSLGLEILPYRLDVMHSPDFIPPAFGARRRVITVHDLNFLYYPQFLTPESQRYYADQIQWAVNTADHVAADSHHTRRDLIERLHVPPEKVTTIHLAANPTYARHIPETAVANTLSRYALQPGYVLFVGTLSPRKNVGTLLAAYQQLRQDTDYDLPLVLIGSRGWLFDDIFAKIDDLGLSSSVVHHEDVSDEELAHLYAAAGLLALPSYYEGFGLPVLEAMHCQCPVIASDRASLPEVAGDAAILVDPDDVDAWAAAMAQVLNDQELRQRLIEAGVRQVSRFSWRNTALATLDVYRQVASTVT